MFIFSFGEETPSLHGGVRINFQIGRKCATKVGSFYFIFLVTSGMRQLPLERGNRDLLDRRTKLANCHGVFQRQRLSAFLIFRTVAVLRALIEAGDESGIDSFRRNFILDGLAKALNQTDDDDDQGDSDHHAEDSEKAAQLVRPYRVERQLKVLFEILLHVIPSFPPAALRWDLVAPRA